MTRIAVVQPYVPTYRLPFFDGLRTALSKDGVELSVVAGQAVAEQRARADAADAPWLEQVPPRIVRMGRRNISLTLSYGNWKNADAVIVPHQGTSLDALIALTQKPTKVGVWGHIAPYTSPLNPIDGAVERWQLRRAAHVFAYVESGAQYALDNGARPNRVTTLNNTIDTTALNSEMSMITKDDMSAFCSTHKIPAGPYFAYVGGIDTSKRIDLLVEAFELLVARQPNAHLVVAGRGAQENLLARGVDRAYITHLGYADIRSKALLLRGALAIANPGRVGLIAVDALVAKRPVVTTAWPWHAPEIEYLHEGLSLFTSESTPDAYAKVLASILEESHAEDARVWPAPPSMTAMIENFRRGALQLIAA